jgi:hypothetical protein
MGVTLRAGSEPRLHAVYGCAPVQNLIVSIQSCLFNHRFTPYGIAMGGQRTHHQADEGCPEERCGYCRYGLCQFLQGLGFDGSYLTL